MKNGSIWMLALAAALVAPVGAQQYVYPAKGQTPDKQKSDEAQACVADQARVFSSQSKTTSLRHCGFIGAQ
jgi:streptogramin lyase